MTEFMNPNDQSCPACSGEGGKNDARGRDHAGSETGAPFLRMTELTHHL